MNDFRQTASDKIHYAELAKGVKHFKDTETVSYTHLAVYKRQRHIWR